MPPATDGIPQFRRICLRVRDPKRSAEFYRTVLGFEPARPQEGGVVTACAGKSPDALQGLELVFTEGLPPGDHLTGLDRLSFEVAAGESVNQVYAAARKSNARATQPRFYEEHYQTFIFDPDGYKVEVFARTDDKQFRFSGTSKPHDQGGRVLPGDPTE